MKEIQGNIWDFYDDYDATCITTNGVVKRDGNLVMGAGIALEAAEYYPDLPQILGSHVKNAGNFPLWVPQFKILSFPTKDNWKDKSTIKLIEYSATWVVKIVTQHQLKNVISPRPGCGLGGLKWTDIKTVLNKIFDDRFTICNKE